jgi:transcription elongation factor GreB
VRFLGKRLEEVTVVADPPTDRSRVFFGAWVALEDEDGESSEWRIVGADESDVKTRAISIDSPVAKALMGRRVGDEVTVRVPKGEVAYTVVGIRY